MNKLPTMKLRLLTDLTAFTANESGLTFRTAMSTIDAGAFGIALIVDPKGVLVGVISDGDVRRALLAGATLDDSAQQAICRNPICLDVDSSATAADLASSSGVDQIIWGRMGEAPRGIYVADHVSPRVVLPPVLLLAGGKGVRLRPVTLTTPKPLIDVGGVPIIERILTSLSESGFSQVYVSVNYMRDKVRDALNNLNHLNLDLRVLEENEPLGTAGPISVLPDFKSLDNLFVMNGDLLVDVDFDSMFQTHLGNLSGATVAVREHVTQLQFGSIEISQGVISGIQEKPILRNLIAAGIYVLNKQALALVDSGPMDMPNLLNNCISEGLRVDAYPLHKNWIDIGNPSDLAKARTLLGGKN